MARPTKWRKIDYIPTVSYFGPLEENTSEMSEITLKLEELEAIRLKDLEGLGQEECADRMEVSRGTFQRILSTARKKIADSLINGKYIRIEGGNFTRNICPIKCLDCGKEWEEGFENLQQLKSGEYICPHCGSQKIVCAVNHKRKFCYKNCCGNSRKIKFDKIGEP